jgi:hypothetical protein
VHQVLGQCTRSKLGRVGLADDDRTGGAQPRDLCRVVRREGVAEQPRAVAGRQAGNVLEVLDPERDALERTRITGVDPVLGDARRRVQLVGVTATAHRMQDRFAAIELRERVLHQLDRRDRPAAQGAA